MILKNFIKSHSVFQGLSDRDLDALAHAFMIKEYADGQGIIQEGKSGKELYLLVEGRVKVAHYNPVDGALEELKQLSPGEIFGLLSLVDRLPSAASCIAVGPVKVGVLQRSGYDMLARSASPIALGFQLAVARQLASDLRHRDDMLRGLLR